MNSHPFKLPPASAYAAHFVVDGLTPSSVSKDNIYQRPAPHKSLTFRVEEGFSPYSRGVASVRNDVAGAGAVCPVAITRTHDKPWCRLARQL